MRLIALVFALIISTLPVSAHFDVNGQHRVIIIDRDSSQVFLRIPAPLIFADVLAQRVGVTAPKGCPFYPS